MRHFTAFAAFAVLVTNVPGSSMVMGQAPPAPATAGPARLAALVPATVITEADCTAAKVGTSIPVGAIGEPVRNVTLAPPRWMPENATLPTRCEVDGSMAPVDTSATAKPINFRVVLPAEWHHRAAQQGGGGINGVIPNL